MSITITERPSSLVWTRNPVAYKAEWAAVPAGHLMYFEVRHLVPPGPLYLGTTLAELSFRSDAWYGWIYIRDLEGILDAFTEWVIPQHLDTATSELTQEMTANTFLFQLRYHQAPYNWSSYLADTEVIRAVKGGVGDLRPMVEAVINTPAAGTSGPPADGWLPMGDGPVLQRPFLTSIPSAQQVLHNRQWAWLAVMAMQDMEALELKYDVTYMDATTATITRTLDGVTDILTKGRMWLLPMGVEQAKLDPTGKGVHKVTLRLEYGLFPRTDYASYSYTIDNRPVFDTLELHALNSVGGWESILLRGKIEGDADVKRLEYETDRYTAKFGTNPYYSTKLRPRWKVTTGYLSRVQAQAMMDAMMAQHCFLRVAGALLPVRITSTSVPGASNAAALQEKSFEIEAAGDFVSFPRQLTSM